METNSQNQQIRFVDAMSTFVDPILIPQIYEPQNIRLPILINVEEGVITSSTIDVCAAILRTGLNKDYLAKAIYLQLESTASALAYYDSAVLTSICKLIECNTFTNPFDTFNIKYGLVVGVSQLTEVGVIPGKITDIILKASGRVNLYMVKFSSNLILDIDTKIKRNAIR